MIVRYILPHLRPLKMLALAGLIFAGCAPSRPQVTESPIDLKKTQETIESAQQKSRQQCLSTLDALSQDEKRHLLRFAFDGLIHAKQKGKVERCPDKFAILENKYLEARAFFYACHDANAADLARYVICEVNTLECDNNKPLAQFTAPFEAMVNELTTFNAEASSDPDKDPLTYFWNFGDGTISTVTLPMTQHRYSKIGQYIVRLTVRDGKGGEDEKVRHIKIVGIEIISNDLLFDFNKATLRPSAQQLLAGILLQIKKNPDYHTRLVGHTDSTGPEDYNTRLSKERALAVKKYLIDNGVAAERITTEWKGETDPIANNDTKEGRQKNRRTEITLTLVPVSK